MKPSYGAGWGLYVSRLENSSMVYEACGPVSVDFAHPHHDVASQPTNTARELTAVIRALQWILFCPQQEHVGV